MGGTEPHPCLGVPRPAVAGRQSWGKGPGDPGQSGQGNQNPLPFSRAVHLPEALYKPMGKLRHRAGEGLAQGGSTAMPELGMEELLSF